VAGTAISEAKTVAVSCKGLTKTVARLFPFTVTTDLALKPLPSKVRVNCGPPAVTVDGLMLLRTGWANAGPREQSTRAPRMIRYRIAPGFFNLLSFSYP
jgi:hypothetical protein